MGIMQKWQKAGNRLDRFAGRVVFRIQGMVAGAIGLAALYGGYSTLASGQTIIGGLLLLFAGAGALWLAKWCFSSRRRLSDIEF